MRCEDFVVILFYFSPIRHTGYHSSSLFLAVHITVLSNHPTFFPCVNPLAIFYSPILTKNSSFLLFLHFFLFTLTNLKKKRLALLEIVLQANTLHYLNKSSQQQVSCCWHKIQVLLDFFLYPFPTHLWEQHFLFPPSLLVSILFWCS